jgi:hypothetical protein
MVLNLILPGLYEEITVKVIGLPYIKGDDVFASVVMWGDPKGYRFEMKIGKTIWRGIYKYMKSLEDEPMNMMMGDVAFKIDEQLSFLKDRILTIRGIPDMSRTFVSKDGKVEHPKVFDVEFQNELEEAEKLGKEVYTEAVFKYVINRESCRKCRLINTNLARDEEDRQKEKEKKKELEKTEGVEWIRKRREKQEKENKKKEKLGDYCGW